MTNEFGMPDFMSEDEEPKKDSFFEGSTPQDGESVVFVFQQQGAPVLPSGEPPKFDDSNRFKSLSEEELIGVYITTNAIMNLLIEKGIITRSQLSQKIQEIKKAFLESRK